MKTFKQHLLESAMLDHIGSEYYVHSEVHHVPSHGAHKPHSEYKHRVSYEGQHGTMHHWYTDSENQAKALMKHLDVNAMSTPQHHRQG